MIVIDMLKTVDISKVGDVLAQYLDDPNKQPIIVTARRKPLVVLMPVQGADVETISVSLNPQFNAMMERSRRGFDRTGGIPLEEVRRRFGLTAIADRNSKSEKRKSKAHSRDKKNGRQV